MCREDFHVWLQSFIPDFLELISNQDPKIDIINIVFLGLGFRCNICKQILKDMKSLKSHCIIRHKKFQCSLCPKSFTNTTSFKYHKAEHEGKLNVFCEVCDRGFPHKKLLRNHKYSQHSEKYRTNVCPTCGVNFTRAANLRRHLKEDRCVKNKNIQSGFPSCCGKTFTVNKFYERHQLLHTHPFRCRKCRNRFRSEEEKVGHECSIPNSEPCPYCERSFFNKKNLAKHMKMMHETSFKCEQCLKTFDSENEKLDHVCSGPVELFTCDFCDHSYKLRANMLLHRAIHTHKHRCNCCGEKFIDDGSLNDHSCPKKNMKPSTKGSRKINYCTICSLHFSTYEAHQKHMEQHKTHICDLCPEKRRFVAAKNLRKHKEDQHGICPNKRNAETTETTSTEEQQQEVYISLPGEFVQYVFPTPVAVGAQYISQYIQ